VLETSRPQAPGGRVLRIDPATGRVTARARVQIPALPGFTGVDVLVVRGQPWVLGPLGAVRLDPDTVRPVQRIAVDPADGEPQPLFTNLAEDGLWVLTRDGRIKRYDINSGRVAEELPARLPGAVGLAPTSAGPLLVTREAEYALADPDDGRLIWRKTIGTGALGPPAIEGDTMIAHVTATGGDRVVALDLETGETEYTVPLPEFGISGATNVGRQIWIATPSGKVMILQR
jgi:outer membrane protein assembly factor BamB